MKYEDLFIGEYVKKGTLSKKEIDNKLKSIIERTKEYEEGVVY